MQLKTKENYLKAMYVLEINNNEIRVTDVANKLNISKASVNKAVKNLSESGLLKYEAYGRIELTKLGKELAKKALTAYNIGVLFLRDILNVEESKAIIEAENIKNSLSDETLNSLAKFVHKKLNLNDLDCDYDINKERCRSCIRSQIK